MEGRITLLQHVTDWPCIARVAADRAARTYIHWLWAMCMHVIESQIEAAAHLHCLCSCLGRNGLPDKLILQV